VALVENPVESVFWSIFVFNFLIFIDLDLLFQIFLFGQFFLYLDAIA